MTFPQAVWRAYGLHVYLVVRFGYAVPIPRTQAEAEAWWGR